MYKSNGMNMKQFGGKVFLAPFQAHVYFQSPIGFNGKRIPVLLNGSAPAQVVHIPTNTARFIAGLNNIIPHIDRVTDAIYEANLDENALDDLLAVSFPHFVVSEDTLIGVKHCFPIFGGNTVEGTVSHILSGLRDLKDIDGIKPKEAALISQFMLYPLLKIGILFNSLTRVDNSFLDSFLNVYQVSLFPITQNYL